MTTEAADDGPPDITIESAKNYNRAAIGGNAVRFVNVFHEALAGGRTRNESLREANAAVRDSRDHPRPKS